MSMAAAVRPAIRHLHVETATAANLDRFGWLLGSNVPEAGTPMHFYDGVLRKPIRFESDEQTDMNVATLKRRPFVVRWLERHFKHTQTFIPLAGQPFILVMAPPNGTPMPNTDNPGRRVF